MLVVSIATRCPTSRMAPVPDLRRPASQDLAVLDAAGARLQPHRRRRRGRRFDAGGDRRDDRGAAGHRNLRRRPATVTGCDATCSLARAARYRHRRQHPARLSGRPGDHRAHARSRQPPDHRPHGAHPARPGHRRGRRRSRLLRASAPRRVQHSRRGGDRHLAGAGAGRGRHHPRLGAHRPGVGRLRPVPHQRRRHHRGRHGRLYGGGLPARGRRAAAGAPGGAPRC